MELCFDRPFKSNVRNCSVDKTLALERQADYRNAFFNLKNVTIIDSLLTFGPQNRCISFDDNAHLLYADNNHLSVVGSNFQVNKLSKQFLDWYHSLNSDHQSELVLALVLSL